MADSIKKIPYEIYKYSSYSTQYLPENIKEDVPNSQTSRWSSNTNTPPQFLTVKLEKPAIIKSIKFGKYEKTHVCNLKKFKIFGGLEDCHMVLLFEGGLKNDSVPETFNLRHTTCDGELMPIIFLQVMPLLSWGPCFNFSIWYIELLGQDDQNIVRTSLRNYNMLREVEIVRLCLKHFRQHGYDTAFNSLQEQTKIELEHPMMSKLHEILVTKGDFKMCEEFMESCINDGLIDGTLSQQDYKPTWILKETTNDSKITPGMRGGHQLTIDSENGLMYLYGGWDGLEDLSDLWCYHMKNEKWELIHENSEKHDGPTPRSCHKTVFDPVNSQIFFLGRYLDGTLRKKEFINSDFYLYNTISKTWLQICEDTSEVGGPQLMFDHQMCIDSSKRTIYVFGGRILTPRNNEDLSNDIYQMKYSGLYSYHIGTNTWTHIFVDQPPGALMIKSRTTHSMLFHSKRRKLYIFGGQRSKEYLRDFVSYDVDTNEIEILNSEQNNLESYNTPQAGFTQRATIDIDKDEIYVLSSLSKERERRDFNINSFWLFSLKTNEWSCIYKSDHPTESCYTKSTPCQEPCPRYAHQLVYDSVRKVHLLFGGNPGKNTQLRLDDFWILNLEKPSREQFLRRYKYLIRRLEYEEITKKDSFNGLVYLQTKLYEIINHNDTNQLNEFHKLATLLFKSDDYQPEEQNALMTLPIGINNSINDNCSSDTSSKTNTANSSLSNSFSCSSNNNQVAVNSSKENLQEFEIKNRRCLLYNKLVEFFPENMVQPKGNLSEFVLV